MNPTAQLNPDSSVSDNDSTLSEPRTRFAVVDAPRLSKSPSESFDVRSDRKISELRTFRQISRDFFGVEAESEYRKELVFFALIAGVAAWPLTVILYHLTQWMISPPPGGLW